MKTCIVTLMIATSTIAMMSCASSPTQPGCKPTTQAKSATSVAGIEFVWVPDGEFMMGSPDDQWGKTEHPQHKVRINGFWMGKYELTVGQFREFADATGYKTDAEKHGRAWAWNVDKFENKVGASWRSPSFDLKDDQPAVCISWNDAKEYCKWASVKNKVEIRLPTEAEWEYACRAGSTSTYYWGDKMDGDYCWYIGNSDSRAHIVGQKKPNAFGLYDMIGNVYEWCEDVYDPDFYARSPVDNPLNMVEGKYKGRIDRGGGWCRGDDRNRCAYRNWNGPDSPWANLGFRVVMGNNVLVPSSRAAEQPAKKIVIVALPYGKANEAKDHVGLRTWHPPGSLEPVNTAKLLKKCLDGAANIGKVTVSIYTPWPENEAELDGTATIVFLGDCFPPARLATAMPNMEAKLKTLMDKGCGIMCVYFATVLTHAHLSVNEEPLLVQWLGGYYGYNSEIDRNIKIAKTPEAKAKAEEIARMEKVKLAYHDCSFHTDEKAVFHPADNGHPILRGWKTYSCNEEAYWNPYLTRGELAKNIVPLVYYEDSASKKKSLTCWAFVRKDGGRGVGFPTPHYYRNWAVDDLRTAVLNSIVWTAGMEVPMDGVRVPCPELDSSVPPIPPSKGSKE